MAAMEVVNGVSFVTQVLLELLPGDVDDLISDVTLHHFDEVLHLVSVQLELAELWRGAGVVYDSCNVSISMVNPVGNLSTPASQYEASDAER